ncbi:MAG TPA: cytochrome c [Burkholderiales bacterium]|nr:cytochrome c [Burkholderiales bacterium]
MRTPITYLALLAAICTTSASVAETPSDAKPSTESSSPGSEAANPQAGESKPAQGAVEQSAPAEQTQSKGEATPATPANESSSTSQEQSKGKPFDVKNTFRGICGFCHEDYGRHAGKGPQLMDSERSDEFMINRIKNGMPGRMPAFGSTFTDAQIHQIVKFIRSLKPNEEPKNPT